ncbi:MAG: C39 family peptidase [Caldilineaceae bacterium]
MLRALSIPHKVQLADGYCLPACAQMVLAYWGEDRDQRKLARQLQTIAGAGTPGSRLTRLASRRLEITYGSGELADLQQALDQSIPPIALVRTADLQYWGDLDFAHAVVVAGMDQSSLLLYDPSQTQAPQRVAVGNFALAWESMGNLYGLIRRK